MALVSGRLLRAAVALSAALALYAWSPAMPAHAATITVTTTADTIDANGGVCAGMTIGSLPGADTFVSLREAICAANGAAGTDTIQFGISGGGVKTIVLLSPLPDITQAVTIDGYTQTGASANTLATGSDAVILIEVDVNAQANGVTILGTDVTIRGLSMGGTSGFSGADILIRGTNARIVGNFLGLRADGNTPYTTGFYEVYVGTDGNATIGGAAAADRNVLSSNGLAGVGVAASSVVGTSILNNYIGLNAAGTAAAGAHGYGVETYGPSVQVGSPGAGNVISGNVYGVLMNDSAIVQSNRIGTNPAGTAAIPNASGVFIRGGIGGLVGTNADGANDAAEGNVISGNSAQGIFIATINIAGANTFTIAGNLIGTNAAGTSAIPNGIGIAVFNGSDFGAITIGGTTPVARNVISGNTGDGVFWPNVGSAASADTQLIGNYIGTNAAGTGPLPNGGAGISHDEALSRLVIGGTGAGQGNVIRHNGGPGIVQTGAAPVPIRGNSIDQNTGLGIDLGNDGVTANDAGDGDSGPNGRQNFPVLSQALAFGSTTRVTGTLNSTAGASFALDFFSGASCDGSGNGEGATFLGTTTTALTDGGGNVSFSFDAAASSVGSVITATATGSSLNTSEFSVCRTAIAPGVSVSKSAVSVTEGGAGDTFTVALTAIPSSVVTVTPGFNAGQLTVTPPSLTFQPDATALNPQVVTVNAFNDTLAEGVHASPVSLVVTSSDTAFNGLVVADVTANITDDDTAGGLSFTAATASVPESGGSITLTVQRAGVSSGVTVQYDTSNGTATAGQDFTTTSGTLSFGLGETSKTIVVPIANDAITEPAETFTVALSNPLGGASLGANSVVTVTIVDDDATGTIAFSAATASVNENGGTLTLTVQRTAGIPSVSTVQYGTGDGTAVAGQDFTSTTGTLTFAAGETSKTIIVPIKDDANTELAETFTVTLANAQGGPTLGMPSVVTVTIIDTSVPAPALQGQDDTDPSRKNTKETKDVKETQEEQQQRERTNRSNRDDVATEGNVIEVHLDAAPPYVVLANRDGPVTVRLFCGSQCPTIKVGDYVEVDGEKQHEQLFDAEQVTVKK